MRTHFRTTFSIASLAGAAVLASMLSPQQASADESSMKDRVFSAANTAIVAMAEQTSADDKLYLDQGRFQRHDGLDCPRCELGPAVAAAALYRRTADPRMLTTATSVMDTAIATQQQPDGNFTKGVASEGGGNLIQTIFFAQDLGAMIYYLGPTLDVGRRTAYKLALTKAADAIVAQGLLTYYINGNINLAATVAFGMTYTLTRQMKYWTFFNTSLAFTLSPPQTRWAGFGYRSTKQSFLPSGKDGAGYLAEKGAGGVGFDPGYTQFQADIAAQGYQVIGDSRLLRLTNLIENQMLPRVNPTAWTIDNGQGSRNTNFSSVAPFLSSGLYVSAANSSPDDQGRALSQLKATLPVMRGSGTAIYAGLQHTWAVTFAALIYAVN